MFVLVNEKEVSSDKRRLEASAEHAVPLVQKWPTVALQLPLVF